MSSAATTNDLLSGLGLVVVLAVGAQLLAGRLRLPAIVLLLPAGFVAGIVTTNVHPDVLLGGLFQPFVSVAVGVILFEAGLRLSFRELEASLRRVVLGLVAIGVLVTWMGVTAASALLFDGLGRGVALMIGAILVVSGPTVVLPLLAFVRPTHTVRTTLAWEGTLVDPIGALLGVLVFHGVQAGSLGKPGGLVLSLGVGVLVGGIGALALRLLLPAVQRSAPRQAAPATLMVVVAGLVCADLLRDDAGFLATTLMGMSLANQRRIDVARTLEFQGTLVQLLIGALFILIAASVSPSDVSAVLAPTLGIVAVMVLVLRPIAVALATRRSALSIRERAFVGWMAPRGIVAGATASAFGLELAQSGVQGADQILPITFVVVFATVCVYGLTAEPVARGLGLAGSRVTTVLVIGGHAFGREVAGALSRAGLRVRLWTGRREEQAAARAAGLEADHGRLIVDAVSREAELEDVTQALLLTASDDFNALAAAELREELGHDSVHRVAPTPGHTDLLPPDREAAIVGSEGLTLDAFRERLTAGEHLVHEAPTEGAVDGAAGAGPGGRPLFVVTRHGALRVATPGRPLDPLEGDTVIRLAPAPDA